MAQRLIRIEYEAEAQTTVAHAATFEGALRAAAVRLFTGQYVRALVYDLRFGGTTNQAPAMKIETIGSTIDVEWNPKKVNRHEPQVQTVLDRGSRRGSPSATAH
jgi:hypothetical protein